MATDIAARGIDVTALGHVINFDVPNVPEDYIHRVGRTARAELTGAAFTLVSPEDESLIHDIERAIDKRLPRVTLPDFDYTQHAPPAAAHSPQHRTPQRHEPRHFQRPGGHRPGASARPGAPARPGAARRRPGRDPRRSGR